MVGKDRGRLVATWWHAEGVSSAFVKNKTADQAFEIRQLEIPTSGKIGTRSGGTPFSFFLLFHS